MILCLDETLNKLNVEHRTFNIERPIMMALRFIYIKSSEPQSIESSESPYLKTQNLKVRFVRPAQMLAPQAI
jgi:hypothetical protein